MQPVCRYDFFGSFIIISLISNSVRSALDVALNFKIRFDIFYFNSVKSALDSGFHALISDLKTTILIQRSLGLSRINCESEQTLLGRYYYAWACFDRNKHNA